MINHSHRLAQTSFSEFDTDDFGGAPICRLRFGKGTRLLYFNLPPQHEVDPRTSRVPLKVHAIMAVDESGEWRNIAVNSPAAGFEIERVADV